MQLTLKILAVVVTILLMVLFFTGILTGLFLTIEFWLIYLLLVIVDILCIRKLKKLQE